MAKATANSIVLFICLSLLTFHARSNNTTGVFPSSFQGGCFGLSNITTLLTKSVSDLAGVSTATQSIITQVLTPMTNMAALSSVNTVASARGCVGNWQGDYITENISECENLLLGQNSKFSVIALTLPILPGQCGATAVSTGTICVAMGLYQNLPTLSIEVNDGTLSCISTTAGGAIGYALGTALSLGLDSAGVGISLSASIENTATLFTGSIVQPVTIRVNYYDYVGITIPTADLGIPDIIQIEGEAYRSVNIIDNANTWVSKLTSVSNAQDLVRALTSYRFLYRADVDLTLLLSDLTQGAIPDIGPLTLGQAAVYLATVTTQQNSGENVLPGFYLYVSAGALNAISTAVTTVTRTIINQLEGPFDNLFGLFGINFNGGRVIRAIESALNPGDTLDTAVGFLLNTENVGVTLKIPINALAFTGNRPSVLTVTCLFKYKSTKFSCKVNLNPGLNEAFLSAILDSGVWVIKKASRFFDETGETFAFAAKELKSFSKRALQQTAEGIQKGTYRLAAYSSQAAAWAQRAVYECGVQTVANATLCGTRMITDAARCGTDFVTDGARCGFNWVTSAAACGTRTIRDAAICGTDTIKNCIKNIFRWKPCKKPKSCQIANSCNVPKSCSVPRSCSIDASCNVAAAC